MKFFIGLSLLLFLQTVVFAQSPSNRTQQKTIDSLNDVAFDIYLRSPDSARSIAEKALLLSEKSKYSAGVGRSFLNIGFVYWSQAYYPIALFYLNKALVNLPKDKPLYISDCYSFIGRTYADLGKADEAFKNLDESEYYAGKDYSRMAEVYSERSYVNMNLKKYILAIAYANRALTLNKLANNQGNAAVVYARLSDIYNRKGEYKRAIAYSDTAYQMSISTHNNRLRASDYLEYALVYKQLRSFDKSIYYAKKSAALADSIGVVEPSSDAFKTLISCYEQQHDLQKAMTYQKEYNRIQDSLNRFDQAKNTELIQNYFTLNSRLNDIAIEEHDNEVRASLQHTIMIAMFKLILLFVLNMAAITLSYFFNYHSHSILD